MHGINFWFIFKVLNHTSKIKNMKFKYYTNDEHGTHRIFMQSEKIELSSEIWKLEGLFTIDELPSHVFPIYVNQDMLFYNILEVREKSVKVKSDDNVTFFAPKSKLFFKNGKLNLTYWYFKAKFEKEKNFRRSVGLID